MVPTMKRNISQSLLCLALVGFFVSPVAFAKEKLDLAAFKGNYTGAGTVTFGGSSHTGTSDIYFTVPKHAKSASINFTQVVTEGEHTETLNSVLTLNRNKTIFVDDVAFFLDETVHPTVGTWAQRKRSLNFTTTQESNNLVFTGTAVVKDSRRSRNLTLTMILSVGSDQLIVLTSNVQAKLPRKSRNSRRSR